MNKNTNLEGKGYSFTKDSFDGGSILEVAIGIFLIIVFIIVNYVNIFIEEFYYLIPIVTIVFGTLIVGWIVAEINDMKPSIISIGPKGIKKWSNGKLRKEIMWGPNVITDVILNDRYQSIDYGPLSGYLFYIKNKVTISISADVGFSIHDIREFWNHYIVLADEHIEHKGNDLSDYLRSREEE